MASVEAVTPERLALETPWSVTHWRHVEALLGAEWDRLIGTVVSVSALGTTTPYAAAAGLLGAYPVRSLRGQRG